MEIREGLRKYIEEQSRSVSYGEAIHKLIPLLGKKLSGGRDKIDAFQLSSLLSILFNVNKHKTLDDILKIIESRSN